MRARVRAFLILTPFIFILTQSVHAQRMDAHVEYGGVNAPGVGENYHYELDGTTLRIEADNSPFPRGQVDVRVFRDLDTVELEPYLEDSVMHLFCKQDECISGSFSASVGIVCNQREQCIAFLNAIKGVLAALEPRPTSQRTPAATPPVQAPQVPARPPAQVPSQLQPAAQATSPAAISALRDLIATISWLNGAQGANNSTLDQLLKQIGAGKQPPPPPPAKPVYAAFAQAGGFDANGAWGAATAADLNTAIASANGNCSKGARTGCDDEGYCVLRSGLWAAWASDLMVAGNSAFACNVKTQDEAIAQAQAWCGDGCKVLWSGLGQ